MSSKGMAIVCCGVGVPTPAAVRGKPLIVILMAALLFHAAAAAGAGAADTDPLAGLRLERNILSSPSLGPVPAGFANWRELFVEQARLNAAARELEADSAATAQLGGIVADPRSRQLQVYWKGDVPQKTLELLATLRRDVPVTVFPANYSSDELLAEATRISRDPRVVWAAPAADASGLDLTLERHLGASDRANLLRDLQGAGLLSSVSMGETPLLVHSRDDAGSPMFAGARIRPKDHILYCTLGFGVQKDINGPLGWLTADHCTPDEPAKYAFSDMYNTKKGAEERGSLKIGAMSIKSVDYGAGFIKAASGVNVGRFVYVGRPFGEDAAVPVGGMQRTYAGNFVFASGSSNGLTGALLVTHARKITLDGTKMMTRAIHQGALATGQGAAVGNGDSGGPVFAFMADGRAEARGVIVMRDPNLLTPCPSVTRTSEPEERCSIGVYFADVERISSGWSVNVLVGDWP